jgi:3-oxoacyl-[acyl-carrier protein] reductase
MLPFMAPHDKTEPAMAVVAGDGGFGRALVAALNRRAPGRATLIAPVDDRADAVAALEQVPDASAVVHVCGDDAALAGGPLASLDAAAWDTDCERVLWRVLTTLQAAHAAFARRGGGQVVVITATAGVSGAAGVAPLLAAIEGARAMAKSAARQWGGLGITVNSVSIPLELLAPTHAGVTSFLAPAALARVDPVDDVAGAVEFLCGPGAQGITGATLLVDGGAVMAP